MPLAQDELLRLIRQAFPKAMIEIEDTAGDNDHYAITVTCSTFQGKTRVEQHKMVYAALEGKMGGVLHALQLKTKTL